MNTKERSHRTYYYCGSWRKDVNFNAINVTDKPKKKFTYTVRASTRKEATAKLIKLYPVSCSNRTSCCKNGTTSCCSAKKK